MSQSALLGVLPSCLLALAIIAIILIRYNSLQALPAVAIPHMSLPAIPTKPIDDLFTALTRSIPQTLPTFSLPRLSIPHISFPSVSAPSLRAPELAVPNVSIPHLPVVSFPKFDIQLPTFSLPSIHMPKIRLQVDFSPFINALVSLLKLLNPIPLLHTIIESLLSIAKSITATLITIVKFLDPRPVFTVLYHVAVLVLQTIYRGILFIANGIRTIVVGLFSIILKAIQTVVSFFIGIYTSFVRSIMAVVSIFSPYIQWIISVSASGWNDLLASLASMLNATASAME
jgi:phage-related protein